MLQFLIILLTLPIRLISYTDEESMVIAQQEFNQLEGNDQLQDQHGTYKNKQLSHSFQQIEEVDKVEEIPQQKQNILQMRVLEDKFTENSNQVAQLSQIVLQNQLVKLKEQFEATQVEILEIQSNMPTAEDDRECSVFQGCNQCLKQIKCGWCVLEQTCVRGDNVSPLHTVCNFYDYKYCSGLHCSQLLDCASCLTDPLCGWCSDHVSMMVSCLEQPGDFTGCPYSGWFHVEAEQLMENYPYIRLNQCPKVETPTIVDIFDESEQNRKKKKKKQPEEPIDRWRVKTWEENVVDQRTVILKQRQRDLGGLTANDHQQVTVEVFVELISNQISLRLEILEQNINSLGEQIRKVEAQLGLYQPQQEQQEQIEEQEVASNE